MARSLLKPNQLILFDNKVNGSQQVMMFYDGGYRLVVMQYWGHRDSGGGSRAGKVQNVVAYFGGTQHKSNDTKNGECNEKDRNESSTVD